MEGAEDWVEREQRQQREESPKPPRHHAIAVGNMKMNEPLHSSRTQPAHHVYHTLQEQQGRHSLMCAFYVGHINTISKLKHCRLHDRNISRGFVTFHSFLQR